MTCSRLLALTFSCLFMAACAFEPSAQAVAGTAPVYQDASRVLLRDGRAAMGEQNYKNALSLFESALVADPGNVSALVSIGQVHEAMGQRSKGLSYYRRALVIEPENRAALLAESLAFLADSGLVKAEQNMERLSRLCGESGCPELHEVQAAIDTYKEKHDEDAAPESAVEPDKS